MNMNSAETTKNLNKVFMKEIVQEMQDRKIKDQNEAEKDNK